MRTLLTLGLVFGLATAEAATSSANKAASKAKTATAKSAKKTTKTAASKTSAKKVNTSAEKKADALEKEISAYESNRPSSSSPTTTSKASGAAVAPVKKASKVSLGFYQENTVNMDAVNDSKFGNKTDLAVYEYATVKYKASDKVTLALLQEWERSWGVGDTKASDVSMVDTQLRVSHSDLGTLPGDVKASGQVRLYLPTTMGSQDAGQVAMLRPLLTLAKSTGPLSLSYNLMPRYYFQQYKTKDKKKDGVVEFDDKGNAIQTGNSYFRIHQFVGAEYAFNDMFSIAASYGIYQGWWYSDPSVNVNTVRRVDGLTADLLATVNATSWLSFTAGIQSEDPMGGEGPTMNRTGVTSTVFDARVLQYVFAANISAPL